MGTLSQPTDAGLSPPFNAKHKTIAEAAAQLGVEAGALSIFQSQMRSLLASIVAAGMKPRDAIELATKEGLPLLENEAPGYAAPEEGIAKLIQAEGGCVPVADAVKLYRRPNPVSRQALAAQIRRGEVVAYLTGSGSYSVPVWQFKPTGGLIDGLPEVLARIREKIPNSGLIEPFIILLQAHPLAGGARPINLLRKGDVGRVLEVVDAYAAG